MQRRIWLHRILLILSILSSCRHSQAPEVNARSALRGVWQDSPKMASGWSDTFQFFEDGHFVFNHNQMNCEKRELSYSGRWGISQGDLTLQVESRRILEGGHLEEALGSCASEKELVDAEQRVVAETESRATVL